MDDDQEIDDSIRLIELCESIVEDAEKDAEGRRYVAVFSWPGIGTHHFCVLDLEHARGVAYLSCVELFALDFPEEIEDTLQSRFPLVYQEIIDGGMEGTVKTNES